MSEKKKKKTKKNFFANLTDKIKSSKKAKISVVIAAAVIILFVGISVYAVNYGNILPGVSVNGVDVGGMPISEASEIIQTEIVEPLNGKTVTIKCGENEKQVSVFDINPKGLDATYIANQAYAVGRSGGWFSKTCSFIGSLFGSEDVKASVDVDEEVLEVIVLELSAEYITEVIETGYTLEGNTLVITKGSGGRCVNMEKAVKLVGEAFAAEDIPVVELVVEDAEPKPVDADEFYAELTAPARNAEYMLEDGKVVIVPEKYGVVVDKAKIEDALDSDEKTVRIAVETSAPDVTAEELRGLLFRDVLGEWSSGYASSSAARANNVELAANRINGYVLMPGDVFSYDRTIGERTSANGYQSAGVYVGNKVESGIGGGICQPSSTLYGAVLYANLEIVERTSHSLPVSYVPAGQDATIAQGYIDFKFKNNTDYPVKIVATYGGRNLTCKILGVKSSNRTVEVVHTITGHLSPELSRSADASIPQGYKKTISRGAGGYTVASTRIVKENGTEVKREKLTGSVYRATNNEIAVNPADMGVSPEGLTEYTGQVIEEENESAEGDENSSETERESVVSVNNDSGLASDTEVVIPDYSEE